jgi:hypothetical protein
MISKGGVKIKKNCIIRIKKEGNIGTAVNFCAKMN